MNTISLTVPMDVSALTRASEMLQGLAADLTQGGQPAKTLEPETHTAAPEAAVTSAPVETPAATEVFGEQQPAAPSPSLFAEQPAEAPKPATTTVSAATTAATPEPAQPATAPAGVDLDGEGLPWDARIHAGSKAKLAKKPHGWKKKRGVDAETIAQVEAELRAAMAASPANPVAPNEPAAPATVADSTPATPSTPAAPAQPAAPAGAVSTFPELMAKITASGIDQATVTAAVNKQGLQALPLLAARPDLIPAVAAELFPGG